MPKYKFEEIAINCIEKGIPTGNDQNLYIGLEHLDSGSLRVRRWGSDVPLKGEKLIMRKGDVLFGKRNTYLRRTAICPHDGFFSAHGMVLRPKKDVVDEKFFPLFIASDYFFDSAIRISVGSLSPTVNWKDLRILEFELPDLRTQRKLANILWAINDTIESYINLINLTDEMVKSQFIEMFGDPKTNPYGFEETTVDKVCSSIVRGPFGSALKKSFFVEPHEGTYKVYEQKNAIQKSATIGTYYISEKKFKELQRFECVAGDIIMSCSGTMGELYQLPDGCEPGIINQALCKFTLNSKILPIVFLTYMRETIGNLKTQGSGIKNIAAVSYIKSMPINLPNLDVQVQFAKFVQQVDKSKFELEQALSELIAISKHIMTENIIL